MPKVAKVLSAIEIKRITERGHYAVGGVSGLLLQVSKEGARSWILRTMVGNIRRDIGLGSYPEISLALAREKAAEQKELIRQGIDPVEQRKRAKALLIASQAKEITFDQAADRVHANKVLETKNVKHAAQWINTLRTYASPVIGGLHPSEVEVQHIVKILEPIWTTKTETATRVRQRIEAVLAWATVSEFRKGDNPARWSAHLDQILPKPSKVKKVVHHKALPVDHVPDFMPQLRKQNGMGAKALEFAILTAARSGEGQCAGDRQRH